MHASTELQLHAPISQAVTDGARVRDRARKPVQFGHNESVSTTDSRQCLIEAGPRAVRPGESMIGIDPIRSDPQFEQGVALGSEVLLVGGTASIADEGLRHGQICNV